MEYGILQRNRLWKSIFYRKTEKINALNVIMHEYSHNPYKSFGYSKPALDKIAVIKVKIKSSTEKKSGY